MERAFFGRYLDNVEQRYANLLECKVLIRKFVVDVLEKRFVEVVDVVEFPHLFVGIDEVVELRVGNHDLEFFFGRVGYDIVDKLVVAHVDFDMVDLQ